MAEAYGWMKRGAEAQRERERASAEAKQRSSGRSRFFLKDGQEKRITFIDGDLTQNGILDGVSYHEHMIKIGGNWHNIPCLADDNKPCAACEAGNRPSYVTAWTVIDHTPFTDKEGKQRAHTRRLFVAKPDTHALLQKIATLQGGLAGLTVLVMRSGSKSPGVGSNFIPEKKRPRDEIARDFQLKADLVQPIDYQAAIQMPKPEELAAQLGVTLSAPVGAADSAARRDPYGMVGDDGEGDGESRSDGGTYEEVL